jgi:hypothetical protein
MKEMTWDIWLIGGVCPVIVMVEGSAINYQEQKLLTAHGATGAPALHSRLS